MSMDIWSKRISTDARYDLYPRSSATQEVDLRQQFINLIDGNSCEPQRGHWVILRRMDTRQRCSCWQEVAEGTAGYLDDNRKYNEPDPKCLICNGTGWVYADELHKTRRRTVTPSSGQGGLEIQADFGIMHIPYVIYYFKHYVRPSTRDLIIEIDNQEDGNPVRPIVKREIYDITLSEPFRDINGRIEYWRCATKKEDLRYGE